MKTNENILNAASLSLLDGETSLQSLIDYIGMEGHPPVDLFEILQTIQGNIQGVWPAFTEADSSAAPDMEEEEPPPLCGCCGQINQGAMECDCTRHPGDD